MKPIIRWTVGSVEKSGYEILNYSIKNIIKLYSTNFDYFVCYNDVNLKEINKLKTKYKINFLEQNWEDCPIDLSEPKNFDQITKQKLNGSFWKICPPRLSIDTHEIILDNDLIFLKKPKIIESFLSTNNKNLIIKDSNSNTKQTLGKYDKLFENKKQGYNSGAIGLFPGYDFNRHIITNYNLIATDKKHLSYADEQGLLMYTLLSTNPIIGESTDFIDIRPNYMHYDCLSESIIKKFKLNDKIINITDQLLDDIFSSASAIHFIKSNRHEHFAWEYFKKKYNRLF
jgi:hypothetical protein